MKLVIITGAAAAGKMTVGQELCKITDLRLFHNHITIEPVLEVFGYYKPDTVEKLRKIFFEDFAKTDSYGLIFTCMWAFDCPEDKENIDRIIDIFGDAEVYHVELVAAQEVRLKRNKTKNRLKNKPSKRNLRLSEALLKNDDAKHRFESKDGETGIENHIKIDNSHLSAAKTAKLIKETFGL